MTLLESMLEDGSVRNYGEIVLIVLGRGRGGLVTFPMEYQSARKWADGRSATGVDYRDLNMFMDKFETCVARAGSSLPTKGHSLNLLKIAKEMKTAGMELGEWTLPVDVREALKPRVPGQGKVKGKSNDNDNEEDAKDDGTRT